MRFPAGLSIPTESSFRESDTGILDTRQDIYKDQLPHIEQASLDHSPHERQVAKSWS